MRRAAILRRAIRGKAAIKVVEGRRAKRLIVGAAHGNRSEAALRRERKRTLRDEAEAAAVVALAKRDPNLWDMPVQHKG